MPTHRITALTGRLLLTATALFTVVGTYAFDWNETHIYNPHWPPHAKFHNGQTMALAVLLSATSAFFLWRRRGEARTNLLAGVLFAAMYWVSQALANLYPGVSFTDPEFLQPGQTLSDVGPQLIMDPIFCVLIVAGYVLARRGLTEH